MSSNHPIMLIPTREMVENLKVGDLALDCFGSMSPVVEITRRCDDARGRAVVFFYTALGSGRVSGHYKEGSLVRTVPLSRLYTSWDLDKLERELSGSPVPVGGRP